MSLRAISSLESARRKFITNSTYIMSTKQESLVFGSGCQNEFNSHQLALVGEKKIFHELDVHHLFLGSGCQNESNSLQLPRIGEKKTFHELHVHHVYKVGITCFLAHDAKMSPIAISSLESARRKFITNSTYIMSTKQESLVFGFRMPK